MRGATGCFSGGEATYNVRPDLSSTQEAKDCKNNPQAKVRGKGFDKTDFLNQQRKQLIQRLRDEGAEDLIGPMEDCGSAMTMVCTHCGGSRDCKIHCKRRWCPACQPMTSAKRVDRWSHAINQLEWPLFITLTMTNSDDLDCIKFIRKAWGRMRRRKIFADKVKGGVASFEITNKGNGWHPHIHAVCDCRWLSVHVPEPLRNDSAATVKRKCEAAQMELSQLWGNVIGQDTAVVWVKRVTQVETMAKEVLKYCLKGNELIDCEEPIAPLLRALKGTRLISGWGSLHPLPSPDTADDPAIECDDCGHTRTMLPADVVSYVTRTDHIPHASNYRPH